jgi:hypothetical protein
MEPHDGYFCRAYIGQDVQANVIARTLREAEQEITRMIRGGAMTAHAVQHGWPDHEPVLVASAYGGTADGELWRYLRQNKGPEFDRWQAAYGTKTKILDDRWVVIELSATGIREYSAFGKAVRAIWGSATAGSEATEARGRDVPLKGPHKIHLKQTPTSKAG